MDFFPKNNKCTVSNKHAQGGFCSKNNKRSLSVYQIVQSSYKDSRSHQTVWEYCIYVLENDLRFEEDSDHQSLPQNSSKNMPLILIDLSAESNGQTKPTKVFLSNAKSKARNLFDAKKVTTHKNFLFKVGRKVCNFNTIYVI